MIAGRYNLHDMQGPRDSNTKVLTEDVNRFPSGMKQLVSYVHSKGLLLGLGTDMAETTAHDRPGSLLYPKLDAALFDSWGYS